MPCWAKVPRLGKRHPNLDYLSTEQTLSNWWIDMDVTALTSQRVKKIKVTWTCFPLERIIHKYQQSKENTMEYRKYHHTGYLLIIDTICWNRFPWENGNISNMNFLWYFSAQVFVLAVENTSIQDFLGRYCTTLQQFHIASWQLT